MEKPPHILGTTQAEYAHEYYEEMSKLKAKIAASEQILETTQDGEQLKLVGQILRRDKEHLLELKKKYNIPPEENEGLKIAA